MSVQVPYVRGGDNVNGDSGGGVRSEGGGDDGWIFSQDVSATKEINDSVPLFLISHPHKQEQVWFTHTGLSSDLCPLTL